MLLLRHSIEKGHICVVNIVINIIPAFISILAIVVVDVLSHSCGVLMDTLMHSSNFRFFSFYIEEVSVGARDYKCCSKNKGTFEPKS